MLFERVLYARVALFRNEKKTPAVTDTEFLRCTEKHKTEYDDDVESFELHGYGRSNVLSEKGARGDE